MIGSRTVLVLGAGASRSYGFPSGPELVTKAINVFQADSGDRVKAEFARLGHSVELQEQFARDLVGSRSRSIDAFLEGRPDMLELGRAAIARLLVPHETPAILEKRGDDDWFGYLFDMLRTRNAEGFQRNRLSVVTFNYDRSFERLLHRALEASFGISSKDATELCRSIPVIHVHGSLLALREYPALGTSQSFRPFVETLRDDEIGAVSKGIRIVSEAIESSEEFKLARQSIVEAQFVYFLGFGYASRNLIRLGVREELAKIHHAKFFGSAFGMAEGEKQRVGLPQIIYGGEDQACLEFLRHHWQEAC